MSIALSGLPGVGKTALAPALAARTGGRPPAHRRRRSAGRGPRRSRPRPRPRLAGDLLAGGVTLVADAVHPLAATRTAWHDLARGAGLVCCDVEVVCGDRREHRPRVEARVADIASHVLPAWRRVEARVADIAGHVSPAWRRVEARVADIAWRDVEAREFAQWLAAPRVVGGAGQRGDDAAVEQMVFALGLDAYRLS